MKPDEFHDIVQDWLPRPTAWDWNRWCCARAFPIRDRRVARYGVAHLEVGRQRFSHHLPACRQNASTEPIDRVRPESRPDASAWNDLPLRNHQNAHPGTGGHAAEFPPGDFVEHDLNAEGRLVPVDRPYGKNKSNIIVGIIRNYTVRYPEGMTRVLLMGDPSKDLEPSRNPNAGASLRL